MDFLSMQSFTDSFSSTNFKRYELLSSDRQTDGQTESDAYKPTVQYAQVGSKIGLYHINFLMFGRKKIHLFTA